jgi:regulator of protease activity HflC (stomatin/prohibitin superfamily)
MSQEKTVKVAGGWAMLLVNVVLLVGGVALFIYSMAAASSRAEGGHPVWWMFIVGLVAFVVSLFVMNGFFTLQPNEARVLILFGSYKGTCRDVGFRWANPFLSNGPTQQQPAARAAEASAAAMAKKMGASQPGRGGKRYKISLRARTLNGDKLKVNDKRGNPIEIGAVVIWHVKDTAQATFDVDNYEDYVSTQSESALRHLATDYAYDHGEEGEGAAEITLRSNVDEVSQALKMELEQRLAKAGVAVDEARLTHLAYAPEIAQAMLRRQQAEAVIAARQKIVHGAVSMVDMALRELSEKKVVELDDERKAAMVSNLMVVLCGEAEVHPVVNAGTLYA